MDKKKKKLGKTLIGVLLLLIVAGISCTGVSAKQNVSAAFTGDIDFDDENINSTCNETTYQETFYLPMTLGEVHRDDTNISITAGAKDTTFDLYINGNGVETSYTLPAGDTLIAEKDTWGVSNNSAYINVTLVVTANETAETNLWINSNDGALGGDNFSYTVTESVVGDIHIKHSDDVNTYTVEDKVKVSQDSDFNLTDMSATFTYPSMVSSSDISTYSYGALNKDTSSSKTLGYQKDGPFVTDIDSSRDGTDRSTELKVYAYENLSAIFDENVLEEPWDDYFPSFDKDSLTIEVGGSEIDFTDPEGQVTTDEVSLDKGYQVMTFNYSTAAAITPSISVQEAKWHEFMGIPYFWPAAIAIGLLVIGLIVLATRRD